MFKKLVGKIKSFFSKKKTAKTGKGGGKGAGGGS